MNFSPNLVVGVVITLMGVVLMLDRLGLAEAATLFRFWPIALILFGLSVVVQAFRPTDPAAPVGPRPRPIISPGFVIMMVVVWALAASSPPFRARGSTDSASDTVSLVGVMSNDRRVSHAERFQGANMLSVMGRAELDLRDVTPAPGQEAVIDVFGVMGRVEIIVPEGWTVDVQAAPIMGRVQDTRSLDSRPGTSSTSAPPPRLIVRGVVVMGALVIRS